MTVARRLMMILALLLVAAGPMASLAMAQEATPVSSADAAAHLNELFAGPGVVFRAPEHCISERGDPYEDAAAMAYCAVKDVVGALGGPSAGAAATDWVKEPFRFEFSQAEDCDSIGAVADGAHDGCAVETGAATLLRHDIPVRLFGVCNRDQPMDCAVLGTITDPSWTPDGVFLLMDPAKVDVHCQYAQDAGRNGCNENDAFTAGQERPACADDPNNPQCEYGPEQQEEMLAAFTDFCTEDAENCLENQLEAQWGVESVVAIGYMNRADQEWDCDVARTRAEHYAAAVNDAFDTAFPLVQVDLDVAGNRVAFGDANSGCEPLLSS